MTETMTSTAHVLTERPARYGKQLASHFGHKTPFTWDAEAGRGEGSFGNGLAAVTVTAVDDALDLVVEAPADEIERFEGVVGRHLVRFGAKDELICHWTRGDGSEGTEQRHDGE